MTRIITVGAFLMLLVPSLFGAGVDKGHLTKYGRGIIEDYSDMKALDEIEWVWLDPAVRLADHAFKVKSFEVLTVTTTSRMEEVFEDALPRTLKRAGSREDSAAVLTVEGAVYWAERANRSKWFIPYAGLHLAQAGVGIELVFRDQEGQIVAKIRHSGREGDELHSAAEELVDDIGKFVRAR
jgi:hypothetical protein